MHGYVQCLALLTRICKSVRTKQNLRITVIQSNDIADLGLIIDCALIGPIRCDSNVDNFAFPSDMSPGLRNSCTGKSTMAMRAAIASSIGAALEWIDFTAYDALSATVFGGC